MKRVLLTILLLVLTSNLSAQSGRAKPTATPVPTPRPNIVYAPTQTNTEKPNTTPAPSKQKSADDDAGEVIRVDSSLVAIPVSVTDSQGRALTNLTLKDFEFEMDGKTVEIGEIS